MTRQMCAKKRASASNSFGTNLNAIDDISMVRSGGIINPLSANPTKWSNNLPTNYLSVDHFLGLALKGFRSYS